MSSSYAEDSSNGVVVALSEEDMRKEIDFLLAKQASTLLPETDATSMSAQAVEKMVVAEGWAAKTLKVLRTLVKADKALPVKEEEKNKEVDKEADSEGSQAVDPPPHSGPPNRPAPRLAREKLLPFPEVLEAEVSEQDKDISQTWNSSSLNPPSSPMLPEPYERTASDQTHQSPITKKTPPRKPVRDKAVRERKEKLTFSAAASIHVEKIAKLINNMGAVVLSADFLQVVEEANRVKRVTHEKINSNQTKFDKDPLVDLLCLQLSILRNWFADAFMFYLSASLPVTFKNSSNIRHSFSNGGEEKQPSEEVVDDEEEEEMYDYKCTCVALLESATGENFFRKYSNSCPIFSLKAFIFFHGFEIIESVFLSSLDPLHPLGTSQSLFPKRMEAISTEVAAWCLALIWTLVRFSEHGNALNCCKSEIAQHFNVRVAVSEVQVLQCEKVVKGKKIQKNNVGVYVLSVQSLYFRLDSPVPWTIKKRFSQIRQLHAALSKALEKSDLKLADLPGKTLMSFHATNDKILHNRRLGFEKFFSDLTSPEKLVGVIANPAAWSTLKAFLELESPAKRILTSTHGLSWVRFLNRRFAIGDHKLPWLFFEITRLQALSLEATSLLNFTTLSFSAPSAPSSPSDTDVLAVIPPASPTNIPQEEPRAEFKTSRTRTRSSSFTMQSNQILGTQARRASFATHELPAEEPHRRSISFYHTPPSAPIAPRGLSPKVLPASPAAVHGFLSLLPSVPLKTAIQALEAFTVQVIRDPMICRAVYIGRTFWISSFFPLMDKYISLVPAAQPRDLPYNMSPVVSIKNSSSKESELGDEHGSISSEPEERLPLTEEQKQCIKLTTLALHFAVLVLFQCFRARPRPEAHRNSISSLLLDTVEAIGNMFCVDMRGDEAMLNQRDVGSNGSSGELADKSTLPISGLPFNPAAQQLIRMLLGALLDKISFQVGQWRHNLDGNEWGNVLQILSILLTKLDCFRCRCWDKYQVNQVIILCGEFYSSGAATTEEGGEDDDDDNDSLVSSYETGWVVEVCLVNEVLVNKCVQLLTQLRLDQIDETGLYGQEKDVIKQHAQRKAEALTYLHSFKIMQEKLEEIRLKSSNSVPAPYEKVSWTNLRNGTPKRNDKKWISSAKAKILRQKGTLKDNIYIS